jgi:hypothetical protein
MFERSEGELRGEVRSQLELGNEGRGPFISVFAPKAR